MHNKSNGINIYGTQHADNPFLFHVDTSIYRQVMAFRKSDARRIVYTRGEHVYAQRTRDLLCSYYVTISWSAD